MYERGTESVTQASSESPGCLGWLLRLFRTEPRGTPSLPYRLRDDFLSPAEMTFYRALCSATGNRFVVCPKVNLGDLFFVARPNENQSYRNRIDRKHLDFLLCDPMTIRPVLGIELDDSSHKRASRQERDQLVDDVFKAAGLPLGHVRVHASYDVADLSRWLSQYLGTGPAATAATTASAASPPTRITDEPVCPKCGVPMVVRVASRGDRQGERFYGCPNYPRCREAMPMTSRQG